MFQNYYETIELMTASPGSHTSQMAVTQWHYSQDSIPPNEHIGLFLLVVPLTCYT